MEDLDRIFTGAVATWGDLGLSGPWRELALNAYGMRETTALGHEFSSRMTGSGEMSPRMRMFAQSADVVAAVASDPAGIGFAAANRVTSGTRLVPLRNTQRGLAFLPTRTALQNGSYPLDRFLYICTMVPMPDIARRFLGLMLSDEGQRAVAGTPQRYVPLSPREAAAERRRLDQ